MIIKPKFRMPPEFGMYCIDQGTVTRLIQVNRTKAGADTPTGAFSKHSNLARTKTGADTPTGAYSYVPPSKSWEITDNFNRTEDPPSGWIEDSGTDWACDGSKLTSPANYYHIRNSTTLINAYRQYAKVKVVTMADADGRAGITLRMTAGTGYSMIVMTPTTVIVYGYTTEAAFGTKTVNNNDWIGFEVVGTGASTTFNMWCWDAVDPGYKSTWGTPDRTVTVTGDRDSQLGVGLYSGQSNYIAYDDFSAGSETT